MTVSAPRARRAPARADTGGSSRGGSWHQNLRHLYDARAAILLRRLGAVAATLMRGRHRARVEDIAMPAEKTLGLSE